MMMPSFGFRVVQSGLSMLMLSAVCAAAKTPSIDEFSQEYSSEYSFVNLTPAGARFAQNVPGRDTSRPESVPNPANVSLQMFADESAGVGSKVSFRVTAKKPGYLLLVDIDANGRMSQIFPNPELIAKSEEAAMNFVKPGEAMLVPNAVARKRGFEYVMTPPLGATAVVAILSDRRVQILDLPDTTQNTRSAAETLTLLTEWTRQLRVPDPETGRLEHSNWSFDIKSYRIQ
jgi:uncharacterized protein DUF4384